MRIPAVFLWHVRLFNAAVRLFGGLALMLGLGLAGWGIVLLLQPGAALNAEGLPRHPLAAKAAVAALGILLVAVGLALLRTRGYQPDFERLEKLLGQATPQARAQPGSETERRADSPPGADA